MDNLCTHCRRPLSTSVIYDHGGRFHGDCYVVVARARMLEDAKGPRLKTLTTWDNGLYES